jgi:hypothetical protein
MMNHLTCHARLEEWPKATTPCAPLKHGDALVAYKTSNKWKERRKEKKNDPKAWTAKDKEHQMWVYHDVVRDNQTQEKN